MTSRKLNATWWIAISLVVALLALVTAWFVLRGQRHQAMAILEACGAKVRLSKVEESFFESLVRGALPGEEAVESVRILPDLQRLADLAAQNRGVVMIEGTDLLLNVEAAPTSIDPRGDLERQIGALRHFPWLRHIDAKNTALDDQLFRQLLVHRRCETLNVSGTEITDAALEGIDRLTALDQISLAHTHVADKGLARLSRLTRLEHLDLSWTAVSNDGLAHAGKLTSLKSLGISGTKVSDEGLRHLHDLKNLRWFLVAGSGVTMEGLREFYDQVPSADWQQGMGGGQQSRGRGRP